MSETRFVLWSNRYRAWWLPSGRGCTARIREAGRFTREQAMEMCFFGSHTGRVDQGTVMIVAPETFGLQMTIAEMCAPPTQGVPVVLDVAASEMIAIRCVECGKVLDWRVDLKTQRPMTAEYLSHITRRHAAVCTQQASLKLVREVKDAVTNQLRRTDPGRR